MSFKMTKLKKRLTAMLMCAAIGVMSCLPVSAAADGCSHSALWLYEEKDGYEVEEAGYCGDCACVYCEAVFTYHIRIQIYKCMLCNNYEETHYIPEYVSHTCLCTTCECVCGYN